MCKSRSVAALAALMLLGSALAASAGEAPTFASATEAYRQGVAALKAGNAELGVPALEYAADRGVLGAQLKLARIYASGNGVPKDDAKALSYYRQIANQRADISPLSPVSKYVAEAFVALGRYYENGIEAAGLHPNARRAADLYRHAASIFGSPDAQYELARLYLEGDGVEKNPGLAINWLAIAAKKQHVAAQAKLGEILWRGEDDVRQRPARGLALIMLAHANAVASGAEPRWITDLYLEAMNAANPSMLKEAQGLTREWGGREIVVEVVPAPVPPKAAMPDQLLLPASGGVVAAPPPAASASAPAGTILSDGAPVPPTAAPMGVPVGFGPTGGPTGTQP